MFLFLNDKIPYYHQVILFTDNIDIGVIIYIKQVFKMPYFIICEFYSYINCYR